MHITAIAVTTHCCCDKWELMVKSIFRYLLAGQFIIYTTYDAVELRDQAGLNSLHKVERYTRYSRAQEAFFGQILAQT